MGNRLINKIKNRLIKKQDFQKPKQIEINKKQFKHIVIFVSLRCVSFWLAGWLDWLAELTGLPGLPGLFWEAGLGRLGRVLKGLDKTPFLLITSSFVALNVFQSNSPKNMLHSFVALGSLFNPLSNKSRRPTRIGNP